MKKPFHNIQLTLLDELYSKSNGAFAAEIKEAIEKDNKRKAFSLGTIVTSLRRLKEGKFISSTDVIDYKGIRRTRYYIEDEGIKALSEYFNSFNYLQENVNYSI